RASLDVVVFIGPEAQVPPVCATSLTVIPSAARSPRSRTRLVVLQLNHALEAGGEAAAMGLHQCAPVLHRYSLPRLRVRVRPRHSGDAGGRGIRAQTRVARRACRSTAWRDGESRTAPAVVAGLLIYFGS